MKIKSYVICFATLFLTSCNKDDNQPTESNLNEIYESLDLKNPNIILNEIATGEVKPFKIKDIQSVNNLGVPPNRYYFEYIPNSNKIYKLVTYNNNQCRRETSTLFYNFLNYISKVETLTEDFCSQEEFTTIYNYNYVNGVLKSVISNNTSFIFEKYFSYYIDGKISIIYSVVKPKSDTTPNRTFMKTYLTYDINGNVKTMDGDQNDQYNIKTTFEYDNKPNPLKGLYINNIFLSPIERLGILSENNIISIKNEYTNKPEILPIISNIQYKYLNNNVIKYSFGQNSNTYFINYQ